MKRFSLPVCSLHRLPKSSANRAVATGLVFLLILAFLQTTAFAAAPLLPKRTVPQRTPSQAVLSRDSLIQQVAFDDDEPVRMVPPAPPLRKPWEFELPAREISSESESYSNDDREDFEEAEEIPETVADFPPFDASQYELPAIVEPPADPVPQTFSAPPSSLSSPPPPQTFVSDPGKSASAPLVMNGLPQYGPPQPPQAVGPPSMLGQIPNQAVNPYPNYSYPGYNYPGYSYPGYNYGATPLPQASQTNQTNQANYGFMPYGYPQTGTAYVNPYGYGPYGYPNTPGAYWGPTGFTANPYAPYSYVSYPGYPGGYPGYPGYPPYGYRARSADEEKSESLTSTTWETLGYFNPFKSPKGPNRGVGGPLMMRSWLDRPFYLGAFGGIMSGGELISGLVDQDSGGTGGIIFGWYADNYWGLESRLHFAGLPGKDISQGQDAPAPLKGSRNNAISMLDVSVHYYPLGNAKWRPFLKLGLGTANQQFRDMLGEKRDYNSFMIPWGIGLKYWWNERIALQMEITDNVLFAVEETKTQNNVALTVGLNFPLGKVKRKDPVIYWPMMPSSGR
ncbi:MAG: porin family protein [Planctomycetaceae bacterium]|nr:porin family protein [Planctomycetaceae bacterium]